MKPLIKWLVGVILLVIFLIFLGLIIWRLISTPNLYTVVKGRLKAAEIIIGAPIVKGGAGVTMSVIYEYEFKNIMYTDKRRVGCNQYEITTSNIQRTEEVEYLKSIILKLRKSNYVNIIIRTDSPDISCIVKNNQLIED